MQSFSNIEINSTLTQRLLLIRVIGRRLSRIILFALILFISGYFAQQVWMCSLYDVCNLLFYFVHIPLLLNYALMGDVVLNLFFVITCKYVHCKQAALHEQMRQMQQAYVTGRDAEKRKNEKNQNLNLNQTIAKRRRTRRHLITLSYGQQRHLITNRHIIALANEIEGMSQFWVRYLTIFFVGYTVCICYMAYCFFFMSGSYLKKAFFFQFTAQDSAFLFYVIHQCATVYRRCRAIEVLNRRITLHLAFALRCESSVNLHCKIKVSFYRIIKSYHITQIFTFSTVSKCDSKSSYVSLWLLPVERLDDRSQHILSGSQ